MAFFYDIHYACLCFCYLIIGNRCTSSTDIYTGLEFGIGYDRVINLGTCTSVVYMYIQRYICSLDVCPLHYLAIPKLLY